MKYSKLQKLLQPVDLPRILGLFFAFLLCIKLLSGCAGNQPVKLSFVVADGEVKFWQPLIKQFNTKNLNKISIELANDSQTNLETSDDLKATYISAFNGKSPPYDLIYMDIIWVPEFAQKGLLLDLTNEFSLDNLKKEFLVSEVDNGLYEDKLYRIPFRTDVGVLYYRKDLLEAVNVKPPETFDELIQISQKVKEQRPDIQYGYLWQGRQSEALAAMFIEVLHGYGGFWIDERKNVGLDQPKAIQAVEFLLNTINQDISPLRITTFAEEYTRSLFQQGQAVFLRNWPNVWVDFNSSDISGNIAIKPMVHAEGKKSKGCKGGWGFGIAKNTKHKKEALKAIEFFTSAASQRQFTLAYGSMPSRRQLFIEPKIVARQSYYPKLLNLIDDNYWVARPRIPEYAQASCILQKHLSKALNPEKNGNLSPQEAMNAAAKETQQLLKAGTFNCEIRNDE